MPFRLSEWAVPQIDEQRLYATIAERIKQARVSKGLSQGELALAAGLERTSVTNIEGAKQRPPLHILFKICQILHVEPTDLLPQIDELVGRHVVEVEHRCGKVLLPPIAASVVKSLRADHETC